MVNQIVTIPAQTLAVTINPIEIVVNGPDTAAPVSPPAPSPTPDQPPPPDQAPPDPEPEPEPEVAITVRASGRAYQGDPEFQLYVGGQPVGEVQVVTANHAVGEWQEFTFDADPSALASPELRVTYLNDAWGGPGGGDRNLYVQRIEVNGVTFTPEQASYERNGSSTIPGREGMSWGGSLIFDISSAIGGSASTPEPGPAPPPQLTPKLDLSASAFKTTDDWETVYFKKWGPLGNLTQGQIDKLVTNKVAGVYDADTAPFAWHVHYWIKALVLMAGMTGKDEYLTTCVSLIDYMFANTDERRVARGEEVNYTRDPIGLKGTGKGGPWWTRTRGSATALDAGQITNGIMVFVDYIYENNMTAFKAKADEYFAGVKRAIDPFDNDWRDFGDRGSYFYRSQTTGILSSRGTMAYNQSATMCRAQMLVNKWEPSVARFDKVKRLVNYWIVDNLTLNPDGTLVFPYGLRFAPDGIEDSGHVTIDLDFLIPAYHSGKTSLTEDHMNRFAKTYLMKVYDGDVGLRKYIDGTGEGWNELWNAGLNWLDLAPFDFNVARASLRIFNARYTLDRTGWARPMLGWANLLKAASV